MYISSFAVLTLALLLCIHCGQLLAHVHYDGTTASSSVDQKYQWDIHVEGSPAATCVAVLATLG